MARVVLLFLVFMFILVDLAHGRPKKKRSRSNGGNGEQGFVAMKTQLENALNENSAPLILSVLRSLPTLKQNICSSTSQPPVTPTTQAANTMANEQDFGWLFDLVSTALAQTAVHEMKMVLKSNPKLRRELCGARRSTRPTTPSTPTPPKTTPTQPPPPPPVVATEPKVKTAPGVSSFVDVALRDEGKSGKRAMPARPTAPIRPAASGQPATPTHPRATEQPPADDNVNDYSDEFLSIPAMRKRRSLASNEVQEAEETAPTRPAASGQPATPTHPRATEQPPADDNVNDYSDEFLSIPAMRKRRSLASNEIQEAEETAPLEHESMPKRGTRHEDDEREFHIATVIPTVFPTEDVNAAPRAIISASNVLEDGQFDETITVYSDPHDQAIAAMDHEEQKQKEEETQDQQSLPSNAETLSQQTEASTQQQREETKLEVTQSKTEEGMKTEDPAPLDDNDVMITKKEMFTADEMPEELTSDAEKKDVKNDNQLAMNENKKNLELPNEIMSNEVDELKQEDWETKKVAPEGGQIKYEVDDDPAERLTKRAANTRLKMKLGKLRKKNIFA